MFNEYSYKDYIEYLTECVDSLATYKESVGEGKDGKLRRIAKALKDPDPFIVFKASLVATVVINESMVYH